jgi:hypothetical protein
LPTLLDILKTRGFQLVTLPEAESDPVYAMDPRTVNDGGTLMDDLMEASEDVEEVPHVESQVPLVNAMCK